MASPIPANGTKRVQPGRRRSLRQVLELQDIAFQAAQGLIADFKETREKEERARVASAISNLAKGWVSLQDAKREILGKPKAGVRKHPVEKPKPKAPPYEWMIREIEDVETMPTETLPGEKPSEVGCEMRDIPGFPGAREIAGVDSLPAKAAGVAGSPSALPPAPPPAPTSGASQPGLAAKPTRVSRPAVPPVPVYHPIQYGR